MKKERFIKRMLQGLMLFAALTLTAGPSQGADVSYTLYAEERNATMPDGVSIPMWGFFSTTDLAGDWAPGPTLTATEGDNLTITVNNGLAEPVSIIIPGQMTVLSPAGKTDDMGRQRVTAFTSGSSFTWTNLKAGTYLYQSGTHPAKQVQMGLYGALIVTPSAGLAYSPTATNTQTAYDSEVVLLYSEIDPVLHDPPGFAQPLNYVPDYYLINGKPYAAGDAPLAAGNANQKVLIRFLNAGLKNHVPMLLNAPYMKVIAEDGNLYPYAREQYNVLLPAGKTLDAVWTPSATGDYAMVDRALYLSSPDETQGGMLTYLQVGAPVVSAPVAVNDSATVAEGGTVNVLDSAAGSVLSNDIGDNLEAVLVSGVSNGSLSLNPDGTFLYTHNGGETTTDSFTYRAKDTTLESNIATVSITVTPVNDMPMAMADHYEATAGETLIVMAPGVLGNDHDPEGVALTAVLDDDVTGGILILNADGSFTYTPDPGTMEDSFTYHATDGSANSMTVTVNIMVMGSPSATAPVAVNDFATTQRNSTAIFINLIANDTDAENNIDPDGIVIVADPTRRGTVTVVTNGVNYTPRRNFQGTDVFQYTVRDTTNLTSNTATVEVTVTK